MTISDGSPDGERPEREGPDQEKPEGRGRTPPGASPISGTAPPEHSRWKKGQSGNPGGRKKGESLTAMLRRVLEREHGGKPIGELLVERLVKEALSGKLPHLKEVLDRVEGRVAERMKIETNAPPGVVVLHMPPPGLIGDPDAARAARAERDRAFHEAAASLPPGTKVVSGECWDAV